MTITANGLIITGDNITVKLAPPPPPSANAVTGVPGNLIVPQHKYRDELKPGELPKWSDVETDSSKYRRSMWPVESKGYTHWKNGVGIFVDDGPVGVTTEDSVRNPDGTWPPLVDYVTVP